MSGDSFTNVRSVETESISLVVTSPPYNIGKSYEKRVDFESYLKPYRELADELFRVLKGDGNLLWQVGNYSEKGEVFPLDIYFYSIFKEAGFVLRNRIVWHFRHGMHANKRLSGRYETILWFAKDSDSTFNLDNIRVPSLYPGKRATKGPRKGQLTGNPAGKNPGDFWADIFPQEWELGAWDIPNVKFNHPEKIPMHPCQFPVELVDRCVLAFSNEGETVFDPFMGVGSSLISAIRNNRKYVGSEFDPKFIELAFERLESLVRGDLRIREPGTPIQVPKGKIARIPDEWTKFKA